MIGGRSVLDVVIGPIELADIDEFTGAGSLNRPGRRARADQTPRGGAGPASGPGPASGREADDPA